MIKFTKAQASGNDFVIIDARDNKLADNISDFSDFAKKVCRRRFSVGADGLLVLEDSAKGDFRMRIFNPDGSEVTMCGNGIRCSALFVSSGGSPPAPSMKIETGAGILEAEVRAGSQGKGGVKVKMTPPKDIRRDQSVGVGKTIMKIHTVNTGVPHAVHFVDSVKDYSVKETGSRIRHHTLFDPEGTNVDFVETIDASTVAVRTYERGVEDETLACGTGVVASAVMSHLVNGAKEPVSVITRSGETLKVYFRKEHDRFNDVYLEGSAEILFEGGLSHV